MIQTCLAKCSNQSNRCKIFVIDEFEEETCLEFKIFEYRNLMDLILNELWEEWGDCRGRAMCGTCHVEVLEGEVTDPLEPTEKNTLHFLPNTTSRSRLACQITIDKSINNMKFRILRDY